MKQFQNIISRYRDYREYYIMADYDTLEEAMEKYDEDIRRTKNLIKEKYPKWYKFHCCDFAYATIRDPDAQ